MKDEDESTDRKCHPLSSAMGFPLVKGMGPSGGNVVGGLQGFVPVVVAVAGAVANGVMVRVLGLFCQFGVLLR